MEDQFIIPTLSRSKISHNLSYPIGAERISSALASTVQLPEVRLHFFSRFNTGLKWGYCEFVRVEYLNSAWPAEKSPIFQLYGRPPQDRWEIVVQPVPRVLRHRTRQYILDSALPKIAQWLEERADLARQGSDILAFFYDDKSDEFVYRLLTQLEPLRDRGR